MNDIPDFEIRDEVRVFDYAGLKLDSLVLVSRQEPVYLTGYRYEIWKAESGGDFIAISIEMGNCRLGKCEREYQVADSLNYILKLHKPFDIYDVGRFLGWIFPDYVVDYSDYG